MYQCCVRGAGFGLERQFGFLADVSRKCATVYTTVISCIEEHDHHVLVLSPVLCVCTLWRHASSSKRISKCSRRFREAAYKR